MILWLDDVGAQNRSRVGGKGASLARCRALGLPVPDGFCVTADAFTAAVSQIRDREIEPGTKPFPFPPGLEAALVAAYDRLGKPAVAVRSSGVDEDGETHSLAGQHETLLGVRGESALFDAVRACWASVWSDSAIEYRRRQGITDVLPIAVVIQPMVAPDVSGVLFTRDPVSGAPGKIVVNASYGLGESVVSGLVVPDVFVASVNPPRVVSRLLGSKETRMDVGEQRVVQTRVSLAERSRLCLDDDQLLRLVDISVRLERHYGSAQDVEWALCDGEVVLLQSRPITAQADSVEPVKSIEPSIERPRSARSRAESLIRADLAEHLPGPMPLDLAAVHRLINAIGQVLDRAGINPPDPEDLIQSRSDGTIRLNVSVPPQHPLRLLRIPVVAVRGLQHDPRRWPQEEAAIRRRLNRLAKRIDRRAEIDSAALIHLLDAVLDAAAHVLYDRYRNYLVPIALTRSLTRRLAAVADPQAGILEEDLARGLPYVTAEANEGVSHLGDRRRGLGLVKAVLDLGPQAHRGLLAGQSRDLFPSIRSLMGILPGSAQAQTGQESTADLLPHGLRGRPGGRRHESSDQQLQKGRHPSHAVHQDHAWRSRGLLLEKLSQEQRSQCAHLAASRRIWCGHAHGQDPQVLRQARALDLQRPSQALRLMTRISENIREHSTTIDPAVQKHRVAMGQGMGEAGEIGKRRVGPDGPRRCQSAVDHFPPGQEVHCRRRLLHAVLRTGCGADGIRTPWELLPC